jgi:mono/diheme cytochrome c family protein
MTPHLTTGRRLARTLAPTLTLALGFTPLAHADEAELARGAYLVKGFGCADCHAPMKPGPQGPQTDLSRGLSGHPEGMPLGQPPKAKGTWLWGGAATNTAFWGPWGISYAANLTPDAETGLGAWTPAQFTATMRTGKHLGVGRPVLPPMPWPALGTLNDADLRAMFAYLQSQPAVHNRVPAVRAP